MDDFTDGQAQDDEQQMDLETENFTATLELGETPIAVDLFEFHRTNKGALSALRRSTVTPRDRARKAILNGEDIHNHSRFFPRQLGNLMLVLVQQRCKDEDHPWSMVREFHKDDSTMEMPPDYCRVDLGSRGVFEVGMDAEVHLDLGAHGVVLYMTHDHDGDRRFHVGVPKTQRAEANRFLEELEEAVFTTLLNGLVMTSTYRVLDRDAYHDERLTLSKDIEEAIDREVIQYVPLMGELEDLGVPSSRGVLLVGEPGTGKTMIVKHIVRSLADLSIIIVTPDELGRGSIRRIFEHARRMSPCVVVLEDLDNVGAISRDIAQHPILGELLVAMDGTDGNSGVLAVATTNNLNLLDGAIRARPGRFDRVIAVEAPSSEVRRTMLTRQMETFGGQPEDLDLRWLVRETEGLTGAYLNEVVKSAFIRARQRGQTTIEVADMEAAVSDVAGSRKVATEGRSSASSHSMPPSQLFA